ncbi:uncharacterized protein LOC122922376 isoform X3 [Bufo gargarizans]|uniref:uncharacterized protein LOC122922376 isoform X3 n=1 Tax=Bufo gargarizans TaxID=30331 RepID=UPI001CF3E803|nr:uncharacterized protein LOC122922376 isoform X3 [Bufo gargarizans]
MRNDFKMMQIISISLLYSGLLGILEISYVGGSTTTMDAYTSTMSPPITETMKQSHKVATTITQPVTTLSDQSSDTTGLEGPTGSTNQHLATVKNRNGNKLSENSPTNEHSGPSSSNTTGLEGLTGTTNQHLATVKNTNGNKLSENSPTNEHSGPSSSNTTGIIIGCFVGLIIFIIILVLIIILRKRKRTSFELLVTSQESEIPLNNY